MTLVDIQFWFAQVKVAYANEMLELTEAKQNGAEIDPTKEVRLQAAYAFILDVDWRIENTPTELVVISQQIYKIISFLGVPPANVIDFYNSEVGNTNIVIGNGINIPLATNSIYGRVRLSVPAAVASDPIAVGDNDPRLSAFDNTITSAQFLSSGVLRLTTQIGEFIDTAQSAILNQISSTQIGGFKLDGQGTLAGLTLTSIPHPSTAQAWVIVADTGGTLRYRTLAEFSSDINLGTFTANRAIVSNGSGNLAASIVTSAQIGYLSNTTSDIQTQINDKQASSANLTSLSGLTYSALSFVKMTSIGTFVLDTSTYLPSSSINGTTGKIPKFASSSSIVDSVITEYNGNIGINNTSPLAMLHVGSAAYNNSVDCMILVSRDVNGLPNTNGHAFSDSSKIDRSGGISYNSFDARISFSGTYNYDHYAAFQAAATFNGSGTITHNYNLFSTAIVNSGTLVNNYATYVGNPLGLGILNNNYGIYIENLTKGTIKNIGIYSLINSNTDTWFIAGEGTADSYLKGKLAIGSTSLTGEMLQVNGGASMTGGWVRSQILTAAFPVLALESTYLGSKFAAIGYDNSAVGGGLAIWVNSATNDITANAAIFKITNNGQLLFGNPTNTGEVFINQGSGRFNGPIIATYGTFLTGGNSITKSASGISLNITDSANGSAVVINKSSSGFALDVQTGVTNLQNLILATSATLTITTAPTTSAGTYDILTRNTSTGVIEKVTSSGAFIQNQNASAQTANFWISGDAKVNQKVYIGTNGAYLEEVLVGSTYELRVVDSAGNITVIS